MTLCYIKQPVEYSFLQWMNNFPDSGHWADEERFFTFVKTVCIYNSKKWQRIELLRKRIIEKKPNFDLDFLDKLLGLYDTLIRFYKTSGCITPYIIDKPIQNGNCIEIHIKKGAIIHIEVSRRNSNV
jgi:hypothetical protein